MKNILIQMMTIIILLTIMTLMMMFISKKSIMDLQKMSPFECGFNSMSKNEYHSQSTFP